jgi:tetratricopeptide (TPR) repeat protein
MPRNTTSEEGSLGAQPHPQPSADSAEPWRPAASLPGPSLDRFAIPLLIAFSLALYIVTVGYDFVGDDVILIGSNPYVRSWHFLREIFTQNFWGFRGARGDSMYYRPLVMFGYLVQRMFFGARPGPFRLFNVLLNTWVVVLVYQLGKRFWPRGSGALWAGLIFAALPVHSEDVATISGISDLECAAFFLLALLLYTHRGSGGGISRLRAWMSAVVFLLATLCKEVAFVVPVLMVFYEHFMTGDESVRFRQRMSRYLPTFLLAAFSIVVHLAVIGDLSTVGPVSRMRLRESLIFGFTQLGEYTGKLIWPQHLSYSWKFRPPVSWQDPAALLGVLFALWAVGVFAGWWRRDRAISFALLWFFLTLAPVVNIAGVGVPAYGERYLYLPSVGLCWIAGEGLESLTRVGQYRRAWLKVAAGALGLVVVLGAAIRTLVRLPVWQNNFTLGLATVREDPNAAMFYVYLGNTYRSEGNRGLARVEYVSAIASDSQAGEAFVNLAGVQLDDGNLSAAEETLRRGSQLNPTFSKPLYVLGKLALHQGNREDARDFFARALSRDPNDFEVLFALGLLSLQDGRLDEAEDLFSRSLVVDPSSAAAHLNLGVCLAREKKFGGAEAEFRRALQLAPSSEDPYLALAGVYEDEGKPEGALGLYRQIVRAAPNSGNAQFRLGVLALKMGKAEESVRALAKAVEVQPTSALAHAQLGLAYLECGNPAKARAEIQTARHLDAQDKTVKIALHKLSVNHR